MMQNRKDLISEFKAASKNREILLTLISLSFPEDPIRKEMTDTFQEAGILPGNDLSLPAAVSKMAILLSSPDFSYEEKQHQFMLNWQGEQS